MARKTLRFRDGFDSQLPESRDVVEALQQALKSQGYPAVADGRFGQGTQDAVIAFQAARGLVADGIVGPRTWGALEGSGEVQPPADGSSLLQGFRGDLSWVHAREGHAGEAYWPGGASGVTLDPGVDLGHARPDMIETAYKDLLSAVQFEATTSALGIKGDAAEAALGGSTGLQSIRISRAQADTIFQYAAQPYWQAIAKRFPNLAGADVLGSVQTALLSIGYNRGTGNKDLEVLKQPIQDKDWSEVSNLIGTMQQDHSLEGIRKRRRMEANLIKKETLRKQS
jgi:peptidoglycan hydrolase-like protein with peptidoglycan-binding domain